MCHDVDNLFNFEMIYIVYMWHIVLVYLPFSIKLSHDINRLCVFSDCVYGKHDQYKTRSFFMYSTVTW